MGRIERALCVVTAVAAAAVLTGCHPRQPWSSRLASVDATGGDTPNAYSDAGMISPDGTKVAFETTADDLGPTDTNGLLDVYVRDLVTGATTLVSENAAGTDSGFYQSTGASFSPDGTQVMFYSYASDLVAGDLGGWDVFLRDLTTGVTTRLSVDDATGEGYGDVIEARWSPDGTRIAFAAHDIYVRDLATGTITLATPAVSSSGSGGDAHGPVFSPDGTRLAFHTDASNLGPADTNGEFDVYVRDLAAGTTTMVSADATGTDGGNGDSSTAAFSPDGGRIAFVSHASDLGPTDTNGQVDVYLRDLAAGTTTLMSVNAAGTDSGNSYSGGFGTPDFSPDGAGVAFSSFASDLAPTDTNGADDVFFRDLTTGATTLVSTNADGTDSGNAMAWPVDPMFGAAGRRVLFQSWADDLGPNDTNGAVDLYVHDLATGVTTLVSTNADGTDSGNGASFVPEAGTPYSADGRHIAYTSWATDLGPTDTNGASDIYVATLRSADLAVTAGAEPEPVATGDTLTYTLDLANAGPDPADDATAALLLPAGTTFTGVTATGGTCSPPTPAASRLVSCTFPVAAVGDVATVTVTADVTAPTGTNLDAVAAFTSATVDESGVDNVAVVGSTVG